MAAQAWRVIEKTVTTGTGALQLLGTDVTFQRFRDRVANGAVVSVVVVNPGKNEAEEMLATFATGSPDTITRIQTISSTNANAPVSFTAGKKIVMLTLPSYACQAMAMMKPAVRAAVTTNVTLASVVPASSLDGVTLAAGDRVGLFGQTTGSARGIYVVASSGPPTRALDFSAGDTVAGASIPVLLGSTYTGQVFVCTSAPGSDVVNTNSLTFVSPQGPAGPAGAAGAAGANGSVWRTGTGVPSNALGVDGDYYLRTSNGDVYTRSSGTYSVVANIAGPANTLTIGTVTTLSPGASATASITGTAPAQVLNLGIPAGATGSGAGDVIGPITSTVDALAAWNDTAGLHLRNSSILIDHLNYDKLLFNASVPRLSTGDLGGGSTDSTCDLNQADDWSIPQGQHDVMIHLDNASVGQVVRLLLVGQNKNATWAHQINWANGVKPPLTALWTCVTLICEGLTYGGDTIFRELARAQSDPGQVGSVIAAGSTQTDAAALLDGTSLVTGADATKGVRLPGLITVGVTIMREQKVNNLDNAVLKVYPPVGGTINGGSTNAPLSFAAKAAAIVSTIDGMAWYTTPKVPS